LNFGHQRATKSQTFGQKNLKAAYLPECCAAQKTAICPEQIVLLMPSPVYLPAVRAATAQMTTASAVAAASALVATAWTTTVNVALTNVVMDAHVFLNVQRTASVITANYRAAHMPNV
jgi:hypothetical protein